MSELYRSAIVIITVSYFTYWVIKQALPDFITEKEFKRWRLLLLLILCSAFLSHSIWVLNGIMLVLFSLLIPSSPKVRVIYYLLLVSLLPLSSVEIPGFAGIRYIFTLNYTRFLTLLLLLAVLIKHKTNIPLFRFKTDYFIVFYVLLLCVSTFRDNTFTNGLRVSFMALLDILIPYLVLSRHLDNENQLNKAILALLTSLAPLALLGSFETLKHWHVYNPLKHSLAGRVNLYDMRQGALRASGITGTPIILGYIMMIGLGLLIYLKPLIKRQLYFYLAGIALISTLLSTMARGPWVGFAAMCYAYMWTGREGIKRITLWTVSVISLAPLLTLTPIGEKFIELLPFIGKSVTSTVDYRKRLFEQSWIVFKRHPWFGSTTFLETPEMESMRQGQGIIDLVNTFIAIALPYGLVGLSLFWAIFLGLLWRCYFLIKRIPAGNADLIRMGRALFAILVGILITIATVSPIDYIPVFYWTFAGIIAAYVHVAENTIKQHRTALL